MNGTRLGLSACGRAAATGLMVLSIAGCMAPSSRRTADDLRTDSRPVVAVTVFDNRSALGGTEGIEVSIADRFADALRATDRANVVGRSGLDAILHELTELRENPTSEDRRGTHALLIDTKYLVHGTVLQFTQEARPRFSLLSLFGYPCEARVVLSVALIDSASGAVVRKTDVAATAAARNSYAQAAYPDTRPGAGGFMDTPLGKATQRAVERAAILVSGWIPRFHWRPMIADVLPSGSVMINGGLDHDIATGMVLAVRERGLPVTDPATGALVGITPGTIVGRVRVTKAETNVAFAAPVENEKLRRGQILMRMGNMGNPIDF